MGGGEVGRGGMCGHRTTLLLGGKSALVLLWNLVLVYVVKTKCIDKSSNYY